MRTDLPLAGQLVQVGHACLEAGWRFAQPDSPCRLVVLAVSNEPALLAAVARAEARGIRCWVFYEPDGVPGYTAACSEPVAGDARRVFGRYPLWSEAATPMPARGPPDLA